MSPKKLSEADKNEILRRYRHSSETTSTLADRYGVSSSTISRFLKSNLPETEYELLIQQKRGHSSANSSPPPPAPETIARIELAPQIENEAAIGEDVVGIVPEGQHGALFSESNSTPDFSSPRQLEIEPVVLALDSPTDAIETPVIFEEKSKLPELTVKKVLPDLPLPDQPVLASSSTEIEAEEDEDLGDEDDFDEDWEDDEADDEDDEPNLLNLVPRSSDIPKIAEEVKIMPLSAASLPKVCYLVVDRSAELIARPLRDFSDLGSIPDSQTQAKTLPVFPNHRVAMRFSNRSQKVIKVPDSGVLQKTSPQLQAKGIDLLLVNGQVYSLDSLDIDE